ncbi:MAG: lipoprotein-releasing ABC transporter permease subunit [Gammaproteobacteria bacterium]|nr:lipoprotein-releasing ABC transporter permease subunit [Gammaproteobacteria bacterium]
MFKPLALYVGLRYMRARKKTHFVSFISFTSMLGIGMGVMVLITVLSVMNGFDEEIHKRFFSMAPEITITGADGTLHDWQAIQKQVAAEPGVLGVAPFVAEQGLITYDGQVSPVMLAGVLPNQEKSVTHLEDKILLGDLDKLPHFGTVLGRELAEMLGVMVGDKVTVMIPKATVSITGMEPRFKRFTVVGIFSAGAGFNFDNKLAFIDLQDAQKLMQLGDEISGLKLRINHVYDAPMLSEVISKNLGEGYHVGNWTEQFGDFFQMVKMEKSMMFLILLLIIVVAAFNLVSSLVMLVNDKQSDIAILRTMGATPRFILSVFVVQGMLVGLLGTVIGLGAGLLLAYNVGDVLDIIQNFFGVQLLASNVYWTDYLPSKILCSDVVQVSCMALLMSFIATLYPAFRASKTVITEALHYE